MSEIFLSSMIMLLKNEEGSVLSSCFFSERLCIGFVLFLEELKEFSPVKLAGLMLFCV